MGLWLLISCTCRVIETVEVELSSDAEIVIVLLPASGSIACGYEYTRSFKISCNNSINTIYKYKNFLTWYAPTDIVLLMKMDVPLALLLTELEFDILISSD